MEIVILSAGWPDEVTFHNRVGQIAAMLWATPPLSEVAVSVYGCYSGTNFGFRLPDSPPAGFASQPSASPWREFDWDAVKSTARDHIGHDPHIILCLVYEPGGLCQAAQQYDGTWPRIAYVCDTGTRPFTSHLHELGHCLGAEHEPPDTQGYATSVMGFGRERPETALSFTSEQRDAITRHLNEL